MYVVDLVRKLWLSLELLEGIYFSHHFLPDTESPSMAKKVLHWKQEEHMKDPTANIRFWDDLKSQNESIVQLFKELDQQQLDGNFLDSISKQVASEWPSDSIFYKIYTSFLEIRKSLKQMGDAAGVPIEPDEQTALCDATMKIPGVVTALVPGAVDMMPLLAFT